MITLLIINGIIIMNQDSAVRIGIANALEFHTFLNQARAWFLEIAFVREVGMRVCVDVCVCVCVRPRGHEKLVA